jgi:hypothetical protein
LTIDTIRTRQKDYTGIGSAKVGVHGLKMVDMEADDTNGNSDIIGVATTDDVDEQDEVVLPGGADLSYIMATKILYADHMYGLGQAIGTIRYIKALSNARGWQFRAYMFKGLENPLAGDTFKIIQQGGRLGVSIGFDALDWGTPTDEEAKRYPLAKSIVRKWRWIELSVTAMPCNVNAYAMAATDASTKSYRESIKSFVLGGQIRSESAYALGLPEYAKGKVMRLGSVPAPVKLMRLG